MPRTDPANRVVAQVLGLAGVPPFVLLAGAVLWAGSADAEWLAGIFVVWSALVLTFIGAIRWGAVLSASDPQGVELGLGIVPSMIAALALTIPIEGGLLLLLVAYPIWLWLDLVRPPAGSPDWFLSLRKLLTVMVFVCHLPVLAVLSGVL
jgi:hypothetical protein